MAKERITFEVDRIQLFDTLLALKGNDSALGNRLVSVLLTDTSFLEDVGMAMYGVTVISREKVNEQSTITQDSNDQANLSDTKAD